MWRSLIFQSCLVISECQPSSQEKLIDIVQKTYRSVLLGSFDTDDRTKISDRRISGAYAVIAYRNTISYLEETLKVLETWFQHDRDMYSSPIEGKEIEHLEALLLKVPSAIDQGYWRDGVREIATLIQLRHEAGWAEAFNIIKTATTVLKDVEKGFVHGGEDQDGVMKDDEEEDLDGSD